VYRFGEERREDGARRIMSGVVGFVIAVVRLTL
jgi:hypothetical protein